MLLAVFAGIAMFGFWGLIIGPVLMIIIVTTISVYLAVYKGGELESAQTEPKPAKQKKWKWRPRTRMPAPPDADSTPQDADSTPQDADSGPRDAVRKPPAAE